MGLYLRREHATFHTDLKNWTIFWFRWVNYYLWTVLFYFQPNARLSTFQTLLQGIPLDQVAQQQSQQHAATTIIPQQVPPLQTQQQQRPGKLQQHSILSGRALFCKDQLQKDLTILHREILVIDPKVFWKQSRNAEISHRISWWSSIDRILG